MKSKSIFTMIVTVVFSPVIVAGAGWYYVSQSFLAGYRIAENHFREWGN